MNWGWMAALYEEVKEQNRQLQEEKQKREEEQLENWKTIVRRLAGSRFFLFFLGKIRSKDLAGWYDRHAGKLYAPIVIGIMCLWMLLPAMISSAEQNPELGGHPLWVRIAILIGLMVLLVLPFAIGNPRLLKGNISAMKLVRLDRSGRPIGREAAMTRQDIDWVCSVLHRPPKLCHLGSFPLGEYGILVDKDYTRKTTILFSTKDARLFRASRYFWTWHLPEEEANQFYGFLEKYVDRLGGHRNEGRGIKRNII